MEPPKLDQTLTAMNPWWTKGQVPLRDAPAFRRSELKDLLAALGRDRIPVLAGMRRTGKTTLMHQAIASLIDGGLDPRRALYASFDDLVLREMGPEAFSTVLEAHSRLAGASPGDTTYAFFDEVQNVRDWATALKVIWDRKGPFRMMASGSSGLLVRGAVGEGLAGRSETRDLGPMDLADWATMLGVRTSRVPLEALLGPDRPRGGPGDALALERMRRALVPLLGSYLLKGGLPEAALADDLVLLQRHLYEDVVERVILRDIPLLHGVRQPVKLGRLLVLIADKSGLPLVVEGLKDALTARRETVEDYLTYLIGSRIVIELVSHAGSQFSAQRRARKYYLADTGLQNAVMRRDARALADETAMGALAEQAVAIHLDRIARRRWERVSYAPAQRGSEVDFVLETRAGPLPIECKHRATVRDREVERLDEYREGMGAERAVMVTRDAHEVRGRCALVPLWMFLLCE